MASGPITLWQVDGETMETVTDFYFGLKRNIQKMTIMASGPITSWQVDGETMETVTDFYFLEFQNYCRW